MKALLSSALYAHQGFFSITVTFFGDSRRESRPERGGRPRASTLRSAPPDSSQSSEGVLASLDVAMGRVLAKTYWGHRSVGSIVTDGLTPDLLRWKGIEATENLSQSDKVVVIGSGADGLPLILGGL